MTSSGRRPAELKTDAPPSLVPGPATASNVSSVEIVDEFIRRPQAIRAIGGNLLCDNGNGISPAAPALIPATRESLDDIRWREEADDWRALGRSPDHHEWLRLLPHSNKTPARGRSARISILVVSVNKVSNDCDNDDCHNDPSQHLPHLAFVNH